MIRRGLEQVLRGGLRPAWLVHCHELLELDYVRGAAGQNAEDPYFRALVLEAILESALVGLGDGTIGRAARLLLGGAPGSRGLLLKDRRRLAAGELDILPSTFRKNYESALLDDLAFELWRAVNASKGQPA